MFCAGRDDVDPCRIDTAVPENICEFGDILFNTVEDAGEQMPQIVREYLFGIDLCFKAEVFHFSPDIRAAQRLACASDENRARRYLLLGYIPKQFLLQIADDEDTSRLAF